MKELFPLKPGDASERGREREPRLIGINDGEADTVFGALSSETARAVLDALYEEPRTASDVAERVDTSLQNATYHLKNLREADLVDVVETWYSAQGREMKVYAPTNGPLVVYAGAEEVDRSLDTALARLFGTVSLIALAGALVNALVGVLSPASAGPRNGGSVGIASAEPGVSGSVHHAQQGPVGALVDAAGSVLDTLVGALASPGGVAFLLGTAACLVLFWLWYARSYGARSVRVGR